MMECFYIIAAIGPFLLDLFVHTLSIILSKILILLLDESYIVWLLFVDLMDVAFETDPDSARYFLSTLLQCEATIFALVISSSLISLQIISSLYSPVVVQLFKESNIFLKLSAIYIVSIVYGLAVLKIIKDTEASPTMEILYIFAFLAGLITLYSLIPYIRVIIGILNPSNIIHDLIGKLSKDRLLASCNTSTNSDPISPIFSIIATSMKRYQEYTALEGITQLQSKIYLILISVELDENEEKCLAGTVYNYIKKIGLMASVTRSDQIAFQIIQWIKQLGLIYNNVALESFAIGASKSLGKIGIAYIESRMIKPADLAIASLAEIGILYCKDKSKKIAPQAVSCLGHVGAKAVDLGYGDMAYRVVVQLGKIGVLASKLKMERTVKNSAISIGNIAKIAKAGLTTNIIAVIRQSTITLDDIEAAAIEEELDISTLNYLKNIKLKIK